MPKTMKYWPKFKELQKREVSRELPSKGYAALSFFDYGSNKIMKELLKILDKGKITNENAQKFRKILETNIGEFYKEVTKDEEGI